MGHKLPVRQGLSNKNTWLEYGNHIWYLTKGCFPITVEGTTVLRAGKKERWQCMKQCITGLTDLVPLKDGVVQLAADEDVVHHVLERADHDVKQLQLFGHLERQLLVGEELHRDVHDPVRQLVRVRAADQHHGNPGEKNWREI